LLDERAVAEPRHCLNPIWTADDPHATRILFRQARFKAINKLHPKKPSSASQALARLYRLREGLAPLKDPACLAAAAFRRYIYCRILNSALAAEARYLRSAYGNPINLCVCRLNRHFGFSMQNWIAA
jgi:hypothetical protein